MGTQITYFQYNILGIITDSEKIERQSLNIIISHQETTSIEEEEMVMKTTVEILEISTTTILNTTTTRITDRIGKFKDHRSNISTTEGEEISQIEEISEALNKGVTECFCYIRNHRITKQPALHLSKKIETKLTTRQPRTDHKIF